MKCSNLCEDNFIPIYQKFDAFGEYAIRMMNQSSIEASEELKKLVSNMSQLLIEKTKQNMAKISHHHARLEASSRILEEMLTGTELLTETRHTQLGMNGYQFLVACFIFLCIGINIEIIRARRQDYTEIL
jgi:hypothetical protein